MLTGVLWSMFKWGLLGLALSIGWSICKMIFEGIKKGP